MEFVLCLYNKNTDTSCPGRGVQRVRKTIDKHLEIRSCLSTTLLVKCKRDVQSGKKIFFFRVDSLIQLPIISHHVNAFPSTNFARATCTKSIHIRDKSSFAISCLFFFYLTFSELFVRVLVQIAEENIKLQWVSLQGAIIPLQIDRE